MKKFLLLFVTMMLAFTIVACGNGTDPDDNGEDPEIEIIFWHAWGDANQSLVNTMFESFQAEYPDMNVSLLQIGQGGFNELRDTMTHAIAAGNTPTMLVGYPDHFAGYINGNALRSLNEFIDHPDHGIDFDDFVEGFKNENMQFGDLIYSMPLAKSTEMVVYNKDVFDHHGIEIPEDRAVTWDDLEQWADVLVGDGDMQCEFLFNADSAANFYINSSRQFGAGYTNTDGEILVDNPTTINMLEYFEARFADNTLVFPIEWDQNYGSTNFIQGDVCMTQGSTAGTRYNIPTEANASDGKFGAFEIGVTSVVQRETCPTDPYADPDTIDPRCSAMQQGPNVAISADATDEEALAAWKFIRHMTNEENTRMFAMATGYIPVRNSAFDSEEYQAFLNTEDPEELPFAMAAQAAYDQVNFYRFDPAFVGEITSSRARDEVGLAIEALFTGNSVSEVMDQLRDRLRLD